MKRIILSAIIALTGLLNTSLAQDLVYEDVSKKKFSELIKSGDGMLIDLRTPKEYNKGHIEGSVNIDYFADNFETEISKLDKSKTVYIYCASGGRSGLTLKLMKKKEFKTVYHLPIGYDGWIEE